MGEFKFACPVCGQHIKCDAERSGSVVECPTCFQKLRVPEPPKGNGSTLVLTASLANGRRYTPAQTKTQVAVVTRPARRTAPVLLLVLLFGAVLAGAAWMWRDKLFTRSASQTPPPAPAPTFEPPAPALPDPSWTLKLAEAPWLETPVAGRIRGQPFTLHQARLRGGLLELRQTGAPELTLAIQFFARRGEDLARQKITIEPARTNAPRATLRVRNPEGRTQSESFTTGYALRLEFGELRDRRVPGKIYFAAPDRAHSWVAGTFEAEIRNPSPPKPGSEQKRPR
ncbi:MAG: hypothetical protein RMK20_01040 [Verrucomicrobiales bacterium]|nr:hypothetical protein [Verrucomicrobiales bacterium]